LIRALKRFVRRALLAMALVTGLALWLDFSVPPPRSTNDLCDVFSERRSWYRSAKRSFERWGVPVSVQMAVIHQESSFRSDALPARRKYFGFLPGRRLSSAFGYGQVLDPTWRAYQKSTGNHGAERDDFADVSDFIGWYGQRAAQRASVPKTDAYRFYLAYHEGWDGYSRGTWKGKPWLQQVARKVSTRAQRYRAQYLSCEQKLATHRWWWPS
jgi:hypothetical protein